MKLKKKFCDKICYLTEGIFKSIISCPKSITLVIKMQKLVLIVIVLILAFGDTRNSLKEIDHKGKIKEQNISIKELVSQFVKILKGKINIPST